MKRTIVFNPREVELLTRLSQVEIGRMRTLAQKHRDTANIRHAIRLESEAEELETIVELRLKGGKDHD